MAWFLIRLLYFEGYWNPKNNINLTGSGQIGDFIGGVSGTLFTLVGVVLLFETLALQRKELSESRIVFEKQQFETTFFNLLNLYQELVKSLHFDFTDLYGEKIYSGKDFFAQQRKKIYDDFVPVDSYSKNRKNSKIKYIEFYTSTKEQTAHYFRTIYRIFRFINTSKFSEEEKLHYAKIVRAQLSESELFFLHYNAYTEYGAKFRKLINEFNILKHLPTLEKLEFKNYAGELEQMQRNSVGIVLDDLHGFMKASLKTSEYNHKSYLTGAVTFKITSENPSTVKLVIIKRDNYTISPQYQQGFGLNNFDNERTAKFITDYLTDLIMYSNYFEYNGKDLIFTSLITTSLETHKHTIEISVSNKTLKPLKFN